ncbi:helix-turn-helix domain-containing protein [Alicyclobacillus kakegawensis]|uniref:helix-turn-helix domain-containing protein n=1 Tax=Alicyclobacillus kakegawensis TaxID=392012 RepID=UPI0008348B2D|nr:helix-turn-helix transcriptional regulator [Alicyclobacillus kakegawensis]
MKRGKITRNRVLKVLRVAAGLHQQDVANQFHADQSLVSRIENGQVQLDDEMEARFVDACGGYPLVRQLMAQLLLMSERIQRQRWPLKPA